MERLELPELVFRNTLGLSTFLAKWLRDDNLQMKSSGKTLKLRSFGKSAPRHSGDLILRIFLLPQLCSRHISCVSHAAVFRLFGAIEK
jgi:hypothetical protein